MSISTPRNFINYNNVIVKSMKEVANELNSFFGNGGPKLTKSIKEHSDGQIGGWDGEGKILQSMFLGEVTESEIKSVALN